MNPKRGELKIKLGKNEYSGKVTLEVIQRIETALDMGIIQIAQSASNGSLKLTEMIFILTPVIKAGNNETSEKEIGQSLWQGGVADGMKAVANIVSVTLGSEEDEGNENEVAQ
jgi:hypothetical protein